MSRVRNLLLIAALVACAGSLWWARRASDVGSTAVVPAAIERTATVPAAPRDPLPQGVHVAVLNGTGEAGLARRFSRQLPDLGCVVVATADAPHDTFSHSLIVNRRLSDALAAALADRVGIERIVREWDDRCREDAVIVLGHDHRDR